MPHGSIASSTEPQANWTHWSHVVLTHGLWRLRSLDAERLRWKAGGEDSDRILGWDATSIRRSSRALRLLRIRISSRKHPRLLWRALPPLPAGARAADDQPQLNGRLLRQIQQAIPVFTGSPSVPTTSFKFPPGPPSPTTPHRSTVPTTRTTPNARGGGAAGGPWTDTGWRPPEPCYIGCIADGEAQPQAGALLWRTRRH